jgi:hypothetical protein
MPVAIRLADRSTIELLELIAVGKSRAQIADLWNCSRGQIQGWIEGNPARREQERQARFDAAEWCVNEAERVLRAIPDDASVAHVARGREVAHHLRWKASKTNPGSWGDKLEVKHKVETDMNLLSDAQLMAIAATGLCLIEGHAEDVTGESEQGAQVRRDMHTRKQALGVNP